MLIDSIAFCIVYNENMSFMRYNKGIVILCNQGNEEKGQKNVPNQYYRYGYFCGYDMELGEFAEDIIIMGGFSVEDGTERNRNKGFNV